MLRIFIITTCILIAGIFLQSKDVPGKSNTFTVYINYEEYAVRANVLYEAHKVKTKMGHFYYWYSNNDIKKTDGSFDGKLLHGEYKSFFRNMNLREEGKFNYGLKDGTWKSWYMDGNIHEVSNYKKGKTHGVQEIYNEEGVIVSRTNYKNGIKNGKMIIYQKDKADSIIIYKNGQLQTPKKVKANSDKKANSNSKKEKHKDSVKTETKKTIRSQDTIANKPKSSFNIKKIFYKQKKKDSVAPDKNKPTEKKENPPKKKSKSTETPTKKS